MCLLNLMIKVSYNESKKFSNNQINLLNLTQTDLHLQAIQSLSVQKKRDSPILLLPGTHDLLAAIGENNCILIETNSQLDEFKQLISLSNEFSTNLMCGVLNYLKRKETVELKTVETLVSLFKTNIINSILKWNQLKNCLNLKSVRSFLNEYICN